MNRFDFYPGDYLRDTVELSAEEDGIYIRLIAWCYSNEKPIPEDRAHVITRADKEKTHWVLNRFFVRFENETGGFWKHNRIDIEIEKAQKQIAANRINGRKGGRPRKETVLTESEQQEKTHSVKNGIPSGLEMGNPNDNPIKTLPSPSPSPSPSSSPSSSPLNTPKPPRGRINYPDKFQNLWLLYPPRGGSRDGKKDAFGQYKVALTKVDHETIEQSLMLFRETKKAKDGYPPDMARWLKSEPWDNDVGLEVQNPQTQTMEQHGEEWMSYAEDKDES